MTPKQRTLGLLVLLVVLALGSYAFLEWQAGTPLPVAVNTATTTPSAATTTEEADEQKPVPPSSSSHGFGTATVRLNEIASFPDGLSLRVLGVLEDSRCPTDVACIQAGTVRLSVRIRSAMGVSTNTMDLGSSITTEAERITLLRVTPENTSGKRISDPDYRFTLEVTKRQGPPPIQAKCYVGGCSGQICTDDPNAVSTCEFRPEYACYRSAKCERQASGQCGWTPTPELTACLANPPEAE